MNQPQTFQYQGFPVDFEIIDSEVYANATTMCQAFGKEVRMWTRLDSTERYVNGLRNRADNAQLKLSFAREGRNGGTWIHEKLILRLAQWLDVDFEIWCDEQLAELIRERQNPSGIVLQNPNAISRRQLAMMVLEAEAEIERLNQEVEERGKVIVSQSKKVAYVDEVLTAKNCWTTTTIAKDLGMSAIALNKILKDLGIQFERDNHWVLKAAYQNKGYTQSNTYTYNSTAGQVKTSISTVWTELGRAFIVKKVTEYRSRQLPTA